MRSSCWAFSSCCPASVMREVEDTEEEDMEAGSMAVASTVEVSMAGTPTTAEAHASSLAGPWGSPSIRTGTIPITRTLMPSPQCMSNRRRTPSGITARIRKVITLT